MFGNKTIQVPTVFEISGSNDTTLKYSIHLVESKSVHLNREAPNSFNIKSGDDSILSVVSTTNGKLGSSSKIDIEMKPHKEGTTTVTVDCKLYVCSDSGMCSMKNESFVITVKVHGMNSGLANLPSSNNTYNHTLTMA
ncbi:hypothetical protein C9374_000634 [Naegleria lovaniensis]|uniref:Uncharacterized protein n=1 Tax=Naegleria lovaniensis TaxID=51637 RepID=A0AA88GWU8_NAELO|nr:uncharacterized protein C9374_000634 [Naegleria lovaniensis]KAG2388470.1 hypothetical protein C9374_000634 [Naegleria lovaniensis]